MTKHIMEKHNLLSCIKLTRLSFIMQSTLLYLFICVSWMPQYILAVGETHPRGSINKLVGDSFNITCTINNFMQPMWISRNLSFYNGKTKLTHNVHVLNSTSVVLMIKNAEVMNGEMLYCKYNDTIAVSYNEVSVGYKPGHVENFKCRSYNYVYMICSFKQMENPLITKYTLEYHLPLIKYNESTNNYPCELERDFNKRYMCTISDNSYRKSYDRFIFDLVSVNEFGKFEEKFEIDHFNIVIPNPPEKDTIRSDNLTSSGVTLYWNLSYKLETLPTEFIHQINITSEFSNGVWESVDLTNLKKLDNISYALQLQNLEYAHTWYDVRIRLKTIKAVEDDLWSNFTSTTFRTASRIPDNPPEIDIGAFHINDYGDIVIYWKELSQSKQNGNDPHFRIDQVYENGRKIDKQPDEIKSTMAKFKAMPSYEYKIHVHSANSIGISTKASVVRIPSKNQRLSEPRRLKKIFNNGEYKIHWEPPLRNQNEIVNYTVFWCVTKSELPNQCESSIDFMQVQPDVLSYALNTTNTINFAISANSHNSSSGMVWALCTAAQSNDIGKIKTIWIPKMDATFMEIQWELECVDRSIVEGYNLTYCPISSPKTLECKEPEQSLNITGATLYNMTDLRPYTTYKTVISMFSKTRIGPPSEPLVNTTLESSPSPPYLLRVTDITNVSCVVHWEAPENLNGVLMYYEIWFNQIRIKVDNEKRDATEMSFLYSKLDSYTSYTILVVACTVGCSSASNKVTVKTKIGVPGPMEQPVYNIRESDENPNTMLVISWEPPAVPFGKLDFYELKTVFKKNNKLEEKIDRIKGTNCSLKYAVCQNDYENYQFSVRAVNVKQTPHANTLARRRRNVGSNYNINPEDSALASYDEINHDGDSERRTIVLKRHSSPTIDTVNSNQQILCDKKNKSCFTENNNSKKEDLIYTNVDDENIHIKSTLLDIPLIPKNNFQCVEADDESLENFLRQDRFAEYLYGNWSNPSTHGCHYRDKEQSLAIIKVTSSCFIVILVIFVLFLGLKKFKRMKDFDIELPSGLVENKDISKVSSNLENSKKKDEIIRARDEQEQSLLGTLRQFSTSSSNTGETNSNCGSADDVHLEQDYSEESNEDDLSLNSQDDGLSQICFQKLSQLSDSSVVTSSHNVAPVVTVHHPQPFPIMANGYVQDMSMLMQPASNGYIQHQAMPRPATSGYTQLNAFGQPILNFADKTSEIIANVKTPIIASTDVQGISGYVTHKQLSDYGHSMQ